MYFKNRIQNHDSDLSNKNNVLFVTCFLKEDRAHSGEKAILDSIGFD